MKPSAAPETPALYPLGAFEPYVKSFSAQLLAGRGSTLEWEDLHAYAVVGLMEAHRTFRPGFGVPFDAYAMRRIQWRMIDGVRKFLGRHKSGERRPEQTPAGNPVHVQIDKTPDLPGTAIIDGSHDYLGGRSIESGIQNMRRLRALQKAQTDLATRERHLIDRVYRDECSVTGAGRDLGVQRSQASRIHRKALQRMRSVIESAPA